MSLSAYIHIPFCTHKCDFCEFAAFAGLDHLEDEYFNILCQEIRSRVETCPPQAQLSTVYFGGGTPGLAKTENVERVLATVEETFGIASGAEIDLETTPHAISKEKARRWRELGITRLSMGIESLQDGELAAIGRDHTRHQALAGLATICGEGFDNISVDFMYALPTQTEVSWQKTLDEFVELSAAYRQIKHVSAYALHLSSGSALYSRFPKDSPSYPDEEIFARMYSRLVETLSSAGFEHYEVSNFARQGFRSRHNMAYWLGDDYYSFGVGAHRFVKGVRSGNWRSLKRYMKDPLGDEFSETIDDEMQIREAVMLGLRMCDGLDLARFNSRFGIDLTSKYRAQLEKLSDGGFVEIKANRLKLTEKGFPVSNLIIAELI